VSEANRSQFLSGTRQFIQSAQGGNRKPTKVCAYAALSCSPRVCCTNLMVVFSLADSNRVHVRALHSGLNFFVRDRA
jgi:hypothetical protein